MLPLFHQACVCRRDPAFTVDGECLAREFLKLSNHFSY
jgi:hypothetical protein